MSGGIPDGTEGPPGPDSVDSSGISGALPTGSWTTVRREAGELGQVATRLLGSYLGAGDCVLAYADYLDLVGTVWSCVVVGDGWSDVCVVQRCSEDACEVRVLRIEADELAEVLAGLDEG